MGHVIIEGVTLHILCKTRSVRILHMHGLELLDVGPVSCLIALVHAAIGPRENNQGHATIYDDVYFEALKLVSLEETGILLVDVL